MGRFYVYMFRVDGEVAYVGKGSGNRFARQLKAFSDIPFCIGGIVRFFATEQVAYDYEAKLIEKHKPWFNRVKGGGGSISRKKYKPPRWQDRKVLNEMSRMGSRKYVARELLKLNIAARVDQETICRLIRVGYSDELGLAC